MRQIPKKRAWHKCGRGVEWMNDEEFQRRINALKQEFGDDEQ